MNYPPNDLICSLLTNSWKHFLIHLERLSIILPREKFFIYRAVWEKRMGWRFVNAGVPGEVTGEGLPRLSEILERDKPALLLLCHGGNDHLRRLNQQQSANNIREMIR